MGGDAHLKDIPEVRRMFLNLIIAIGGTIVLARTIILFPTYWFTFLQATIVAGGLGCYFLRTRQPAFSLLFWSMLFTLMWIFLVAGSHFGHFALENKPPTFWTWNLGLGTGEFGLFFALTCGLNFSVFASTQCRAFCRIRQPWGMPVAVAAMLAWSLLLTKALILLFQFIVPAEDAARQAQLMCRHTVFWGFALSVLLRRRSEPLSVGGAEDARHLRRCGVGPEAE